MINIDELNTEEGKNKNRIVCQHCTSKILPPRVGTYEEIEFALHPIRKKTKEEEEEEGDGPETLNQYYRVEEMFDFDNVGFSNTVGDVKFLICADCEIGPIGWHSLSTKKSYIALQRIAYAQ